MAADDNLYRNLELHRQLLEENVAKLQASLHHWEQWYLEYSLLKEDVTSEAPADSPEPAPEPSRKHLARIRRDFESDLITKKELHEILGKNDLKPAPQILSILDRRLDYVGQNIETLQKQLQAATEKLAKADVVASPDGGTDEETGLPITDIIEELDEDGNVIDFRLQSATDAARKGADALEKVGVATQDRTAQISEGTKLEKSRATNSSSALGGEHQTTAANPDTTEEDNGQPSAKKSVSFAADTKSGHDFEDAPPISRNATRVEQIMKDAREQQVAASASEPIIPDEESEDEAEIRRQMLEYGMNEIGPIVAELEIDEGDDDDDDDYDYTDEDAEETDEEDRFGRSKTTSFVNEDYVQRMLDLQKKLGVKSSYAIDKESGESSVGDEGIARIKIQGTTGSQGTAEEKSSQGVAVSPAAQLQQPPVVVDDDGTEARPLGDVVERTAGDQGQVDRPNRKPSRFKKVREAENNGSAAGNDPAEIPKGPKQAPVRFLDEDRLVAPSGPEGQTHANTVVERDVSMDPKEPDELDSTLIHQEAAVEYQRMRNRFIQREGGFLKEEEEAPIQPLDEEDGGPKRVSRFKAARLSKR